MTDTEYMRTKSFSYKSGVLVSIPDGFATFLGSIKSYCHSKVCLMRLGMLRLL